MQLRGTTRRGSYINDLFICLGQMLSVASVCSLGIFYSQLNFQAAINKAKSPIEAIGVNFYNQFCNILQGVPKRIVFRNVVLFWLAGAWAFKIWVILGSKNIHAITRCLALVPNVPTLVCTPLSLYTSLNGHLIRGFAIFLKTILFWDTLYNQVG